MRGRSERQVGCGRGDAASPGVSVQQRLGDAVRAREAACAQCQGRHQLQGRQRSHASPLRHAQGSRHGHQGQTRSSVLFRVLERGYCSPF